MQRHAPSVGGPFAGGACLPLEFPEGCDPGRMTTTPLLNYVGELMAEQATAEVNQRNSELESAERT